jgi:hypothetical protein
MHHVKRSFLRSRALALLELERRDVPTFLGNQVFPLDNPWNQVIASAPVAADSAAILGAIAARHGGPVGLHPDFGNPVTDGALYGIPINVVDGSTALTNVLVPNFAWPDESDLVPVPIPATAVIEGDGPSGPSDPSNPAARHDSHLLVYNRTTNVLYELASAARPNETSYPYGGLKPIGQWGAYQISMWDLNANTFRTVGATSADAAGLPIMPGLVRPDEALPGPAGQGVINHAIRMTVQQTQGNYIFPASHLTGGNTADDLPRMGERFRLKASFVIPSNWSPEVKAIAQAMKSYGLIVADNGSDMFFQGTPSAQWNMSSVLQISQIDSSDFDVVDLTPVVSSLSTASGSTAGGTSLTIYGKNFGGAAGQIHVLFGSTEASSITIVSDSQLNVVAPSHSAGTVDVVVQSGHTVTNIDGNPEFFGYGTSARSASDEFTFAPGPPPPPPIPPAASATPLLTGGSPDGVAAIYLPDGAGHYSAAGTMTPFGVIAADVRTAVGDVNGDGTPDLIFATGPGVLFQVAVLDGKDRSVLVPAFAPFDQFMAGGFVSAGDFNRNGRAEIVVTPDQAGGPRISIYELAPGSTLVREANYFTLDSSFRGGLRTAVGDVNGDGMPDLAVAAGFGGGPRIALIDGNKALTTDGFDGADRLIGDFFAFDDSLRNGVYLAIGDVNGDGAGDLVIGAGPGGGPRILTISGGVLLAQGVTAAIAAPLANFLVANTDSDRSGVRPAILDADGDGRADVVVGSGGGKPSLARIYLGKNYGGGEPTTFQDLNVFSNELLLDGLFVG